MFPSAPTPPALHRGFFAVAYVTQRLQIDLVVRAARRLRQNMIHVSRRRQPCAVIAERIRTQRMAPQKHHAQSSPRDVVAALVSRATLRIERLSLLPGVRCTASTIDCDRWTARLRAWPRR